MSDTLEEAVKKKYSYPRVKVSRNLFKRGKKYYYRKGETEKLLGEFETDAEAERYRDLFEAKRDVLGLRAINLKAKDVWPDYLQFRRDLAEGKFKKRRQHSARTFYEIESVWSIHLARPFANKSLGDITDPLWARYCDRAQVNDLTNHRKVLKTFLKWCMTQGYIRTLPVLEIPEVTRRKRRILTTDEISALIGHAHGRLLVFISLYLLMGLRWTEIRLLKWEAIDFENVTLTVHDDTTRTRKGRILPVNAFVMRLLIQELAAQKTAGLHTAFVFPKRDAPDEAMIDTAMRRPWSRLLVRAGVTGITPHDMRATFEYYAARRSDFTDVQREKMAGASIETQSKRYLVSTDAEFVRGLEESVRFEGIEAIVETKLKAERVLRGYGKTRDEAPKRKGQTK